MTVREPGYRPRRPRSRIVRALPALAVTAVLVGIAVPFGGGLIGGPGGTATPPVGALASPPVAIGTAAPTPAPTPPPTPRPTPTPEPTPAWAAVPIVPVTNFRSPYAATGWAELEAVGTDGAIIRWNGSAWAV
ncbi:MAG TPA: hypothetical protein PKB10_02820, partial [Tepidisphaeraceae bacterium]|nr:hypothetical protein [Tepidisphaeraceae bacterium]